MSLDKMPIQRAKAAVQLMRLLRRDGPFVAEELALRLETVLEEGEEMPDVAHFLNLLARLVYAESANLDAADDARHRVGGENSWVRKQLRHEVAPELRKRVVEVRRWMVQFYGAQHTCAFLHLWDRTPRNDDEMALLAGGMVRTVGTLESVEVAGETSNPTAWVKYLKPVSERYEKLAGELENSDFDFQAYVKNKRKARIRFDKTYRRVLRLSQIVYELAGLDDEAKNLRYREGRPPDQKKGLHPGAA